MFAGGLSKTRIAEHLGIRKATIIRWLSQSSYHDDRGWQKDNARKYSDAAIEERICQLKRRRIDQNYFVGDDYVQMDYAQQHPSEQMPSLWFINKTVRKAGLQTRKAKSRRKGGSEYLLYPVQSIRHVGRIHQSADFIGKKYIAGRTEPINIFSTSYYAPFKLYQIKRIAAEKGIYAVTELQRQWTVYPIPHVLRLDNGLQFRGTASGKRVLGLFITFLLNLNVTPLFGSPSKPWTNPHIEGHNRVFNEKVWGKNFFTSLEQIDHEAERFNQESIALFNFKYAQYVHHKAQRRLKPTQRVNTDTLISRKQKKIYFVRFVESLEEQGPSHIMIMNEQIFLPEKYNHQFVFVEWDIERERLTIYSEYKGIRTMIENLEFKLND